MPTTITSGSTTITPSVVDGYESTRQGQTLLHWVVGRTNGSPDTTLRAGSLRSGKLRLVFTSATSEADSLAADTAFMQPATFSLTSTDRTSIPMMFVVPQGGQSVRTLDDETRNAWIVVVDFQEYL